MELGIVMNENVVVSGIEVSCDVSVADGDNGDSVVSSVEAVAVDQERVFDDHDRAFDVLSLPASDDFSAIQHRAEHFRLE